MATKDSRPKKIKKQLGSTHDKYLDAVKGAAILIVVLGHSVQLDPNFDSNSIFRFIYSFHMPLFMFLSGCVAALSSKPMGFAFIKNKAAVLLIPFVSWYLIAYYITDARHVVDFWPYIHRCIISPDYGLWFLPVLFLNFVLLSVTSRLYKYIGTAAFAIIWFLALWQPEGRFGLGLVHWYYTFFLLGYLVLIYGKSLVKWRMLALNVAAISFPILVMQWHRIADPDFAGWLQAGLVKLGFEVFYDRLLEIYKYLVPLAGIGFIFWLLKLRYFKFTHGILSWFGLHTLDIYVSHLLLIGIILPRTGISNHRVLVLASFIIGVVASLTLSLLILRQIPILNRILLGGRKAGTPIPQLFRNSMLLIRR